MSEQIILILEAIGTIAFSITGVLVAVEARLDIFGTCVIGMITAIGGGMIRDVMLGNTPPLIFNNPFILLLSLLVCVTVFTALYFKKSLFKHKKKIEEFNNLFDAIGLAVFSIMGVETAINSGCGNNPAVVIISGMLTGIGGGILRDVLTKNIPFVLRKHVYAVASLAGILVFCYVRAIIDNLAITSVIGALIIIAIRILATMFKWNLPTVNIENDGKNK